LIGTGHAYNFLLPFAVKFYNAKSIATEHIARKSLPFTSKFLQRLSYPFLDCVVVLSQSAKNEYPFSKNLVVIPNSLPFDSIEQSELNHKTILTVGRLSYEKGIDRLLEVASLLNGKCDDWSIKIFGNGDIEDELREEVVKKGLSNFVFIHNAVINIQKEYLESAIYLMTSRFEAFPMVLLEAKSCGLPVIAYDCPEGPREIVNDGVDGFLIENGNVKDMAKKVLTLINDIDLRKTMGLNARNSLSKYKEQSISTLWFDLLNRI
jgi:glycosyltransferase involved in cell wall biosynthesis